MEDKEGIYISNDFQTKKELKFVQKEAPEFWNLYICTFGFIDQSAWDTMIFLKMLLRWQKMICLIVLQNQKLIFKNLPPLSNLLKNAYSKIVRIINE